MSSLKTFIKAVRASKTLADERSVIQKESAAIRTSFRDNTITHSTRKNNIAKLLYLFTLGERTHFGQVECLKLIASPKFTDKRLGYLGIMLLLDENQEVITLVTNSLQMDLSHPNQYVVSLALTTLANIASTEMSRDLFADIEKILSSSNPYLRKKGALCAMKIIQKVPDLQDSFIEKSKILLNDKNHGVLLGGVSLVHELCLNDPSLIESSFVVCIPTLIKHLKNLSTAGYAPEHDITGISDPFLQVKILRLLRVLGEGDAAASEQMNDILAQIASNTDSSKNVGNAILYETVLTIFGIQSDSGLKILGINILGKFLSTNDNNTRYVALNTLLKVIEIEPTAVQRHRNIIVGCLQDSDISIRRRALDLSYALVNESNIRVLVRELLIFLESADNEFKSNLTTQIALAAERFAPNKRWHIDTILRMLRIAGNYVKENVLSAFISLVINSPEDLQLYTLQKLYVSLQGDFTQESLTLASVWLVGELGHLLLKNGNFKDGEGDDASMVTINDHEVVSLLDSVLASAYATEIVKQYALNSLMKLTTRIKANAETERIRKILSGFSASLDVEIQQRVVEYGQLFTKDAAVRNGVLELMPAPEIKDTLGKRYLAEKEKINSNKKIVSRKVAREVDMLLDLMGDSLSSPSGDVNGSGMASPQAGAPSGPGNVDLLADIFGGSGNSESQPPTSTAKTSNNILDLFDTPVRQPSQQQPQISSMDSFTGYSSNTQPTTLLPPQEIYNSHYLLFTLQPMSRDASGLGILIQARFVNQSTTSAIEGLSLQIAVPKSQKLQLNPISSNSIAAGGHNEATQQMKIQVAAPDAKIKLRIRVIYTTGGQEVKEQIDYLFPQF
ncbi:Adaptor protein complex AP-1 gamma subunit [Nadsonia fulvescens var. elongata DSM 6958]|uniref:AP-1 complex subunit gamma n=1 Tax=Nadsonia fulvescens var. elongata DSM 6958 TaxID=857566 RepID=A0A1E3PLH7_9ASCO|nr:Adaptor protein complex AP-1 gamma subunit [Nadsonia fulvescens var. elongata DSM 6958]